MSRKRKTPKELASVIMTKHSNTIKWIEEKMAAKQGPLEQQADHIKKQTLGEMAAYMDGYNACLEDVMHAFNCYAGFHYMGRERKEGGQTWRQSVSYSDPDFHEWRRTYYTNGIAGEK